MAAILGLEYISHVGGSHLGGGKMVAVLGAAILGVMGRTMIAMWGRPSRVRPS